MTGKEKEKFKKELINHLNELEGVHGSEKFKMLIGLMLENQAEICQRADVISIDIKDNAKENCNIEYPTVKKSIRLNITKKREEKRKNDYMSSLMLMKEMTNANNEVKALSTIANKNKQTILEDGEDQEESGQPV